MYICIEVLNTNNRAEVQANAIAKHYNTTSERMDDGTCQVKCNKALEKAFTLDEETFVAACEEVSLATGVHICIDDICF